MTTERKERKLSYKNKDKDRVCEFECNVDDMSAEEISYATGVLMREGALDVTVAHVGMKKGRQGAILTVMIPDEEDEKEKMLGLIFKYTSTIGIREVISERYVLERETKTIETPYGKVRCKVAKGYGVRKAKIEYDDLAKIADNRGISIAAARELVQPYVNKYINDGEVYYV